MREAGIPASFFTKKQDSKKCVDIEIERTIICN